MSIENEKIIKDAQYRKGLSIAFFNATNSAIALMAPTMDRGSDVDLVLSKVFEIRDKMLEEHKNYYATVISSVGINFSPTETIKKLNATTDKQSFKSVWLSLSEDERHHDEIKKVAKELKKKYEK